MVGVCLPNEVVDISLNAKIDRVDQTKVSSALLPALLTILQHENAACDGNRGRICLGPT